MNEPIVSGMSPFVARLMRRVEAAEAERDAAIRRAEAAEADADRLAEELADTEGYVGPYFWDKWGYADTLAAHATAVAERGQP